MAESRRGDPGGILTLLDTIEEHRGAVEYDWRSRFHLPITCIPDGMGYGEAWRLLRIVAADPSSQTAAAISGWAFPLDRAAQTLAVVAENVARNGGDKRWTYPRPWDEKPKALGSARMTPRQMRAFLDEHRATPHESTAHVVGPTTAESTRPQAEGG